MSDRQAALDMALKQIEKQFGKGSIMKLGEQAERKVSTVSSGSLAMDPLYAQKLGVNIDELLLSQPDTGEQGLEIAEALVRSGAVDIIVIDSVAALVPKAEIEGDMGDSHVGLQARLMSQALRKLSGAINKSKTIAIFINQIREKVGVMFGNQLQVA